MFDVSLISVILSLILVVVLRIRPFNNFCMLIVDIAALLLIIPMEALSLHYCGTTPGKWLKGIRIEDPNGGKLSFQDAKNRTCWVMWDGMAMHAIVGYRPGATGFDRLRIDSEIEKARNSAALEEEGSHTYAFQIKDVAVEWCIQAENCITTDNEWVFPLDFDSPNQYSLDLTITITE